MQPPESSPLHTRKHRKFVQFGARTYAVTNWQGRKSKHDVAIISPLTEEQNDRYIEGKDEGHSDTTLFRELFPPTHKPVQKKDTGPYVKVHVDVLTREQLILAIEQEYREKLPWLVKLGREDLVQLLNVTMAKAGAPKSRRLR